jgi:hypothetical protein
MTCCVLSGISPGGIGGGSRTWAKESAGRIQPSAKKRLAAGNILKAVNCAAAGNFRVTMYLMIGSDFL